MRVAQDHILEQLWGTLSPALQSAGGTRNDFWLTCAKEDAYRMNASRTLQVL